MAHPGGRPTKYKPEYCEMLVNHGRQGYSFESFAGILGICKETLYNWFENYPEFLDARKKCIELSRIWWEKKSVEALEEIDEYDEKGRKCFSKKINPTVLIFNMKNRFRDQWQDRIEVDSKIDANVKTNEAELTELQNQVKGLMDELRHRQTKNKK